MQQRQKRLRHVARVAFVLAVGVCTPIAVQLAQGAAPPGTRQNSARDVHGTLDQWVRTLPAQCQDEGRVLQGLVVGLVKAVGDVQARPTQGEAQELKGLFALRLSEFEQIKAVLEGYKSKFESFVKDARCQQTREIARRLLKDEMIEPLVRDLGWAKNLLTRAVQSKAGACLSLLGQNLSREATTPQDRDKFKALDESMSQKISAAILQKRWELVRDETELALLLVDQIKEWTALGPRELYRAELFANRAVAFLYLRKGNRAENVEAAIEALDAAIQAYGEVSTQVQKACEDQSALARVNLGLAYHQRIKGERADNLERAISQYEKALTVLNRTDFPHQWATAQTNLGGVYLNRIRHKRAENVEAAIKAFNEALKVWGRQDFPAEWAMLQHNLGTAYSNRIRGNHAENIQLAIAAFQGALGVRTREHPSGEKPRAQGLLATWVPLVTLLEALQKPVVLPANGWAESQNGLGVAYFKRVGNDRAEDIEKGIAAFEDALKLFTPDAFPAEWAALKSNLAEAYISRLRGSRHRNIELAIAAAKDALTVRTYEAFPRDNLETATLLGQAWNAKGDWREALGAFAMARRSFLLLFGQGLNEAEARDLLQKAGPLFTEAAYAAAELGDAEQALALLEEGKTRLLAAALKLDTLSLSTAKRQHLDELRRQIREGERLYESPQGEDGTAIRQDRTAKIVALAKLRATLAQLVDAAEARTTTATNGNVLSRVTDLIPEGGALVAPIVAGPGGKLIIVTPRGRDAHFSLIAAPEATSAKLDEILGARDGGGWLGAYSVNYLSPADPRRFNDEWLPAIDKAARLLGPLLGRPLVDALSSQGVKPGDGAPIVILPTGALGLLPLGLARDVGAPFLMENYTVALLPSLTALASAKGRGTELGQSTLAAVVNPTGDLPFTAVESALVESHFASGRKFVIREEAATPPAVLAALRGRDYWHFASHGTFDWEDGRASALVMNQYKHLTVGGLLDADGLGRPRLVVLSACETGLYDIATTPNEFIGLPAAFLQLGAGGVLATLWPVPDLATALLVAKFYDLHRGKDLLPPAQALRQAQNWLRATSTQGFRDYVRTAVADGRLTKMDSQSLEHAIGNVRKGVATPVDSPSLSVSETDRPFAHPYYWGGFTLTGL